MGSYKTSWLSIIHRATSDFLEMGGWLYGSSNLAQCLIPCRCHYLPWTLYVAFPRYTTAIQSASIILVYITANRGNAIEEHTCENLKRLWKQQLLPQADVLVLRATFEELNRNDYFPLNEISRWKRCRFTVFPPSQTFLGGHEDSDSPLVFYCSAICVILTALISLA